MEKKYYKKRKYSKITKSVGKRGQFNSRYMVPRAMRMGKEVKQWTSNSSGTLSTTFAIECLSAIARGDAEGERLGNRINAHVLSLYITFFANNTDDAGNAIRYVIFQDLHNMGTDPVSTDLFDSDNIRSPFVNANRPRFRILKDKVCSVDQKGPRTYFTKEICKVRSKIFYDGSLASNRNAGQLYIALAYGETNAPTYQYRFGLSYSDD